MGSRLELQSELENLHPDVNIYFQQPSNDMMIYPCIVYSKTGKSRRFGNDSIYLTKQQYQVMVIERNPDSDVADNIEKHFQYCTVTQYYTVDNLNHTTLNLYY